MGLIQGDDFSNGTAIYIVQSERIEDWVGELVELGVEFDQMPSMMRYLWREAVLRDPSGYRIKLYHAGENRRYPPWRVELRDEDVEN